MKKSGACSTRSGYNRFVHQLGLYFLGPFQATFNGAFIRGFTYDKVRALLAYLAVESHSPHHRETLATLLWPEDPPEAARASLRKALSVLRQAIRTQDVSSPHLIVQQDWVQFNTASDHWLDVAVFQTKLEAVDKHAHLQLDSCAECIRALEEAVSLYRGEFLQGLIVEDSVVFEDWVLVRREHFHARLLTALHNLTLYYLRCGKYSRAQQYALQQIAIEPYREEAHRALMRILSQSNQRSAALAQYETCRRILDSELGVEPDAETQALYERIRSAGEVHPSNLPPLYQPLVGREAETQIVGEQLCNPDCRLLTLVGVGGVGKTSLALQAARAHRGYFLQGVFWVSLAPLQHPDQILAAVLEVLPITVTDPAKPKGQFLDYLREKSILLVLDNFEHLLPQGQNSCGAGVDLLNEILQAAPNVKMLVTSRERLRLRAEWVIPVGGLPYPADLNDLTPQNLFDYAAVRLFIHRARQVVAGFAPSEEEALSIARICQQLLGVPLALELAAGWVDSMACSAIADQVSADLNFLVTALRDTPDRHQSLQAVFRHSWNLLAAEEQAALRKLSVFQATFHCRAARQVSGVTLYQLAAFVNKSFLSESTAEQYTTHPLLKQFLHDELAADPFEMAAAHREHAAYYASYLQEREQVLVVQHQMAHLDELGAVMPDLRAAWAWAVAEKDTAVVSRMLDGLYIYFWAHNQFQEGRAMFESALGVLDASDPALQSQLLAARLQSRLAEYIAWLGDLQDAEKLLRQSVDTLRQIQGNDELPFALDLLGRVHYWQGDFQQARQVLGEAIQSARLSGVAYQQAQALNALATVICEDETDYELAQKFYAESLTLYEKVDNPIGIAKVLVNQGAIFYEQGDYARARDLYQRSLEIYQRQGYPYGVSAALNNLSLVTRKMGDFERARQLVEESLLLKREAGNRVAMIHSLLESGSLDVEMGDYAAAHDRFCEALRLALAIQSKALVFDIFVGFAGLYHKQMMLAEAAEIAAWVLAQDGGGQEAKDQTKILMDELGKLLPADELARCKQRAACKSADEMAEKLLSCALAG